MNVGKIEQLTENHPMTQAETLSVSHVLAAQKAIDVAISYVTEMHVERVAKWQCIEHDEDPIAADGSEQWKNYIPLAREILGIL